MQLKREDNENRSLQRRMGIHVNDDDEANRIIWEGWEGLDVLNGHSRTSHKPGLLLQVAIDQAELPDFATIPVDPAKSTMDNPYLIADKQQKLLKKHRSAIKALAEAGNAEAKTMLNSAPKSDSKKRLRAINSVISARLASIKEGCGTPGLTNAVCEKCKEIGRRRFQKLPGEYKEAIFIGQKVHPLSIK